MSQKLPALVDAGKNLLQRSGSLVPSVLQIGELLSVGIVQYAENCRHQREIDLQRERLRAEARLAGERLQAAHCETMAGLELQARREENSDRLLQAAHSAHERDCDSVRTALGGIAGDAALPADIRLQACKRMQDYFGQAHAQRRQYLPKPPDVSGT